MSRIRDMFLRRFGFENDADVYSVGYGQESAFLLAVPLVALVFL